MFQKDNEVEKPDKSKAISEVVKMDNMFILTCEMAGIETGDTDDSAGSFSLLGENQDDPEEIDRHIRDTEGDMSFSDSDEMADPDDLESDLGDDDDVIYEN